MYRLGADEYQNTNITLFCWFISAKYTKITNDIQ